MVDRAKNSFKPVKMTIGRCLTTEIEIFTRRLLCIKILCLSLQPILDKNQRDRNKAIKV
jgi:hypothetical protein